MDENLINQTIEEYDVTTEIKEKEIDVSVEDIEHEISAEETAYDVVVEPEEEVVIDISESMGWVSGDNRYHDSLLGIDFPNQHPITAIAGLRDELDEIEALKTVYSDQPNIANYYEWKDAAYDEYGYFVSLVPGTFKIDICGGTDIFGVSVDTAGFIGGQDANIPRDNKYGLIATSGLVGVRCELDVDVGDCVVSNIRGYAKKSDSNYGYKVLALAKDDVTGVEYAVISLGVQADQINALGKDLDETKEQVVVNYKNIVSAVNVANQAYNKANEINVSNQEMSNKVDVAVYKVKRAVADVENMSAQVSQSAVIAAQAKAIAESAATSAESMRNEAVEKANNAWSSVGELTKTLQPITSWTDENGTSGVDYLTTQMNAGIATSYDIKTVDEKTEKSMNAITRNAKELQSLMTVIDKYSVGEYSQANGLTLEQAQNILEMGMIYVPTHSHTEEYAYIDGEITDGDKRTFVSGYLYRWGKLSNGLCGWIIVDKEYSRDKLNTSAPAVYFHTDVPSISGDFGYWYTNGDIVSEGYEPYTLYKWEKPKDEDGYWFAVATLAGNVNNRATSQVRQTANEVMAEVTNARGSYAGLGARLTNTESVVASVTAWKEGKDSSKAIIRQESSDGKASIVISALAEEEKADGTTEIKDQASLVLNVVDKDDGNGGTVSSLVIDADHINLNGVVTANNNVTIGTDGKITAVNADITGTISASEGDIGGWTIDTDSIFKGNAGLNANTSSCKDSLVTKNRQSSVRFYCGGTTPENGEFTVLEDGSLYATAASIKGKVTATSGQIGGWNISPTAISNGDIGMSAGDYALASLFRQDTKSPVRFYTGKLVDEVSDVQTQTLTFNSQGTTMKKSITLGDEWGNYEIDTVTHVPTIVSAPNVQVSQTYTMKLMEAPNVSGSTGKYGGTAVVSNVFPSDAEVIELSCTGLADSVVATHLGNGNVQVSVTGAATSKLPVTITGAYKAYETLDINITHTDTEIEVTIHPKQSIQYSVTVHYLLKPKGQKFIVLEDGSLYASAAKITGDISATSGEIGNCVIDEDGSITSANGEFCVDNEGSIIITSSNGDELTKIQQGMIRSSTFIMEKIQDINKTDVLTLNHTQTQSVRLKISGMQQGYARYIGFFVRLAEDMSASMFLDNIRIKATFTYSYYSETEQKQKTVTYTDQITRIDGDCCKLVQVPSSNSLISATMHSCSFTFVDPLPNESSVRTDVYSYSFDPDTGEYLGNYMVDITSNVVGGLCVNTDLIIQTKILPQGNTSTLGEMGSVWNTVYADTVINTAGNTIAGSDREIKDNIKAIDNEYDILFDALSPVSFIYKQGNHKRTHTGLIAQDLKRAINLQGLTPQDFAAYCEWLDAEGHMTCGIRYADLIPLNINQIQKLKKRVEELENKNLELAERLTRLETLINTTQDD